MANRRLSPGWIRRAALPAITMMVALLGAQNGYTQDASFDPPFPRLAAGQIGGSYDDDTRLRKIAKHDVAVLGIWPGWSNGTHNAQTLAAYLKSLNPDLVLANYTIVVEANPNHFPAIHQKVTSESGPGGNWYLKDSAGNFLTSWDGTYRINHSKWVQPDAQGRRYPEWYAEYWRDTLVNSGWDAVYSDVQNVDTLVTASWDGGANRERLDPLAVEWNAQGHVAYHDAWARQAPDMMFFGNMIDQANPGRTVPSVYQGLNEGGWFEGLMGVGWSPETWGGWHAMMDWYRKGMSLLKAPKIGMFHNVTDNSQGYGEYRWNRYGLASCLMDNGYYMASVTLGFAEQRWYDEFDVDLGYAVDPPQTAAWSNGVFKREFEKGLVLVNPRGNGTRTVNVGEGWRRFSGTQDPVHNNGQPVTTLTLNDADGIILLREGTLADPRPKPPTLSVE